MLLAQISLAAFLAFDLHSSLELYRQRQFSAAEGGLRRLLAKNPKNATARLYLIRTLIELDRIPEALTVLQQLTNLPMSPETQFDAGRILRELADSRHADLQEVAPDSAATRELTALRYEWTGALDEALKSYREAAALDSKRPGIHYRIGNLLWRKRELDAAVEELKQELALSPYHGMANLRMGQIHLNLDQSQKAVEYLQQAVSAIPDSNEARRELGKAYRKSGRLSQARTEWEAVAKTNPNDDQIHYLLGGLYRELGETALANRELKIHRAILGSRRDRPQQQ